MFEPRMYAVDDVDTLHAHIRTYPLATVCCTVGSELLADHIPLILYPTESERGVLRGHIARVNPLSRLGISSNDKQEFGADALCIFHGPDMYISPSWYATKATDARVVPTWNYVVVHVKGRLTLIDDTSWMHALLADLTDTFESSFEEPWSLNDAPSDYVAALSKEVIGVEITIRDMRGKWKVSQNQPPQNRASVIEALEGLGTDQATIIADLIRQRGR